MPEDELAVAAPPTISLWGVPLLSSKVRIPRAGDVVPRPRVRARLAQIWDYSLTLVTAPAGAGKTSALVDWARADEGLVAWLSLDRREQDSEVFLVHLLAAVARVDADVERIVADLALKNTRPSFEAVLVAVVNHFDESHPPVALVLDDFHLAEKPEVLEVVRLLVEHAPSLHLVVATRRSPALPLSRWRTAGGVGELSTVELQFSEEEVEEMLNGLLDLGLDPGQLSALRARTEGWAAGLRLAAMSLSGHASVDEVVEQLGSRDRFVFGYLLEEVFSGLPVAMQEFLLDTSVLDELSAPLCDAVTASEDARSTLERLVQDNVFLVSVDDEGSRLRYHHLFSDFLRERLEATDGERAARLRARAAAWYEARGDIASALGYALQADDPAAAADLIERSAEEALVRGVGIHLLRWIDAVPPSRRQGHPWLTLAEAWMRAIAGHVASADELRARAMALLDERPPDEVLGSKRVAELRGHALGIQAYIVTAEGQAERSRELVAAARRECPEPPRHLQVSLLWVQAKAQLALGDLDAADATLEVGYRSSIEHEVPSIALDVLRLAGEVDLLRGHLGRAHARFDGALRNSFLQDRSSYLMSVAHLGLARVLIERNELDEAAAHVSRGLVLAGEGPLLAAIDGALLQVRAQDPGTRGPLADEVQEQLAIRVAHTDSTEIAAHAAMVRARLNLEAGRADTAEMLLLEWGDAASRVSTALADRHAVVLAQVRSRQGHPDQALKVLAQRIGAAEVGRRDGSLIELQLARVPALIEVGDAPAAAVTLRRALGLAAREGYVRLFVEAADAVVPLLGEALSDATHLDPRFIRQLSRALAGKLSPDAVDSMVASAERAAQEARGAYAEDPLSDRELEVLVALSEGLDNQQIGEELFIARSTVKKHINRIFRKVGVDDRERAVEAARSLGLLPDRTELDRP